jgi:GNAT superfamily N-acetyltransferase
MEIRVAKDPRDIAAVQSLWKEYWAFLGLEPEFQNFTAELQSLPGVYVEPDGLLLIAWAGEKPAGTIALRRLSSTACEAKRLYVPPGFRGCGLGRALLDRLIVGARSIGYRTIYGDSLRSMSEAQALYRSCGFQQVEAYSATPTPGAIYLALALV